MIVMNVKCISDLATYMKCMIFRNFDACNNIEKFVPELFEVMLSDSWH